MSLASLRAAIAAALDAATPPSVTCAEHGGRFDIEELRRVSAKAPALFVAVLGFSDCAESCGSYEATVSWAVFSVARDKPGVSRDRSAMALVDALALIVPGNTWGLAESIGTPDGVRGDNLFSATVDKAGVAMWATTWRQRMQLGSAMPADALAALDLFATFDARFPVAGDAPVAEDRVSLPQDGDQEEPTVETKTLYLKPVEGRVVRDPQGGEPLPASGKAVPDTSYWRRRLKDGDAEKTTAQAIAKAVAKKEGQPMPISFNGIPNTVRVPLVYIEFDNSRAVASTPAIEYKLLVLGQKLAAGSAEAAVPVRVLSADHAVGLFGRGSMLASMFAALKAADAYLETWCIPLADADAGVAATGSIALTGTATAAGTLNCYIGGQRVRAAVSALDTAAVAAAALASAINAALDLPVTAVATEGTIALTARHKGECGNGVDVRFNYYTGEVLPAGLATAVTAMTGGSGNPDIADAIDAFGDEWWNALAVPWTDASNMAALETELLKRWGPLSMQDGQAYSALRATHSGAATWSAARNSHLGSCMPADGSPTPPWVWAAVYAVVASASLSIDPARPLQTLALPGVLPPAPADRWTMEERDLLLHDGLSTFTVDSGGVVRIERAVTTYQTNTYGLADPSYLDVTTPATLSYIRYATRARITQKFPRHKLADDGTRFGAGQAIVTPSIIRAELLALFRELEAKGLVEDFDQYKADLVVERNADDRNRVDVMSPPNIVNQLRILAEQIQFILQEDTMANNPNQVTGKAVIRFDGVEYKTADDATLNPGGVSREPVKGAGKVHGFTESTEAPELECTLYHTADVSLATLQAIDNATVIFETDTGSRWVLTGAFVTDTPTIKTKGGEISLKLSAITCEEDQPMQEVVKLHTPLRIGEHEYSEITLRELTAADVIDAQEEAEKLVMTPAGPQLVASPTKVGLGLLRRQVIKVGDDVNGPLDLATLKRLSVGDLNRLQHAADAMDAAMSAEAVARASQRGRGDGQDS